MGKLKQYIDNLKDLDLIDDEVEEYYDIDDPMVEEDDWDDNKDVVSETLKRKKVVRGGKVIVKKVSTKKGYKIKDGQEIKISPEEMRNRKRGAKKAKVKKKGQKAAMNRKRKLSMKRRSVGSLNTQSK